MRYLITRRVIQANGWQQWSIEANSREEALQKHEDGEGEFITEEIDITSLGEPDITEDE